MRKILPPKSWVLMQDFQIMERWLADCIIHDRASPPVLRGVQLAVNLWPGAKWIGHGMSYNMAALRLDVDDDQFNQFIRSALRYQNEGNSPHLDLLKSVSGLKEIEPEAAAT